MSTRMDEQQQRRRETSEPGTRHHHLAKASSSSAAAASASQDALAQPIIIECRKKNSKQESVVTHRFRKGKLLGKGGFAHCYKVTCLDTARPYAMKIVPKSTLVKSRARQKLQTEIKIHRTLQHPRVVRFEMFFEDRENVYILLELCTNHSLSELIRKTKRFTEEEARRYMLQILEATSYLHRHQIIHRDLKLGNVFLDRDWNIKMGDFGLATKLAQDSERKRTICGTPNYIAPEILEGKAGHSYQVDLWSAGVILYTLLVGRPPYESTDVKSTYRRILANVYAFPESVPVSDSAKNLVGRLLQVKPELRPSLDEILNHPFLRNGGPRQRFSTSHGLRGSSASSSPPSSAVPNSGGGVCGSTASRLGAQKHSANTPERCAAGGFGRPPLKTRSSNVEAEVEVPAEGGGGRSLKPRAGAPAAAAAGKAGGDGGSRDTLAARQAAHAGPAAAKRPSSSRSAVPRTNSTKGFSVYCDPKEASGGGGTGSRGSRGGSSSGSGSKRGSPMTSTSRRREAGAAAAGGGGSETVKSPGGKENDPRPAFGGGGGVRVPVNGPISRRPVARASSSVGSSAREAPRGSRVRSEMSGSGTGGGVGGTKGAAGSRKGASLRRSASAIGTTSHAERHRRTWSARDGGGGGRDCARGKAAAAGAGAEAGAAATPGVRCSSSSSSSSPPSRGVGAGAAGSSPVTPTTYSSTYRSPLPRSSPAAGGTRSGGRGGGRVSARTAAVGAGATPRGQTTTGRGYAQQRLDFGGTPTPRSSRQRRDSPLGSSRSSGGGGGKATRSGRLGTSCPASKVSKDMPASGDAAARGRRGQAKASATTAAAAAAGGSAAAANPRSLQVDLERDTLENMHEVLAAAFAVGGPVDQAASAGDSSRIIGRSGVARGTRASAAAAREAAAFADEADSAGAATAPKVWVTRYVDYSSKYGLGFLLSDGSAGVYFNDATKIVLEPAGVAFEYIERARRSPPAAGGGGGDGGSANSGDHPPRARHTLDDFPPDLQKKVTLLNHFHGYLHELVKKSEGGGGGASSGAGGEAGAGLEGHGQQPEAEMTFLRKWMRTRNAILFRLSNRTVQVVFSDHTEVLLSREARVVTFVDKDGKRETLSLQRVLRDQRPGITKRVRYSNELIAQLLRRA